MKCCYKDYEGCHIKGLPIGVPFRSKFFIPKLRRSEITEDIDVFILLRLNTEGINYGNHCGTKIACDEKELSSSQNKQCSVREDDMNKNSGSLLDECSSRPSVNHEISLNSNEHNGESGINNSSTGGDQNIENSSRNIKDHHEGLIMKTFYVDILKVLKHINVTDFCKSVGTTSVGTKRNTEKSADDVIVRKQRKRTKTSPERHSSSPLKKPKIHNTRSASKTKKKGKKCTKSSHKVTEESVQIDYTPTEDEVVHTSRETFIQPVNDQTDKLYITEESEKTQDYIFAGKVSDSKVPSSETNVEIALIEQKDEKAKFDNHTEIMNRKSDILDARTVTENVSSSNTGENKSGETEKAETNECDVKLEDSSIGEGIGSTCTQYSDTNTFEQNIEEDQKLKEPKIKSRKTKTTKKDKGNNKSTPKKVKKTKVIEENVGEEMDPDLQGLSIKEKLQVIKQRKKIEKESQRIKVKLHDHPDKYRMDIMDSFARKDRGKSRYESAIEIYVCTVCEKFKAESMDVMETHIESHVNGELHCDQCTYIAPFVNDLLKHKRQVHKRNINICYECGVETNGPDGLKDHLGKVHGKPQYKCKFCLEKGEHFSETTKHSYRQHIRQVHPDKMAACQTCPRLFANATMLKKHLELGCAGDKPSYACEKCGKTYNSQDRVNDHVRRVHNKVRRFQCPHCPFSAARGAGLSQHLHIHTGYHPFKCDQCTFTCVQKYQLTSHMRTHNGLKPYKCTQCNFAAAWNVQLKDHMKVHGMTNIVVCERCNIFFKDMRSYNTHVSKEHPKEGRQIQTDPIEIPQPIQPVIQPMAQSYTTHGHHIVIQPLEPVNFMSQQMQLPVNALPNNPGF